MKNEQQNSLHKVLPVILSHYHKMEKDIKSVAYQRVRPYFPEIIHQASKKMYQTPTFQREISDAVKDVSPEQFLMLLKNLQVYQPARSPFLSKPLNEQINELFRKDISRVYLQTHLDLNKLGTKARERITQQLENLDQTQLHDIIQLMVSKNGSKTAKEIRISLQISSAFAKRQREIKTFKHLRNFAIFGAIATLTFGSMRAETKMQKTAAKVGSGALAVLAIGTAHAAQKRQYRIDDSKWSLRASHPCTFDCLEQIQKITTR